jgi:hypothetical protein
MKAAQSGARYGDVTGMHGIERAAEQRDALTAGVARAQ